ncbi:MAG: hypothetical protein M2R45_02897 [Verrucomicrobia subdivision 3 bacterium]|nr:hypothetical protein [Limisphaerales bacterium]MCS1414749.1 hypothetical protein [Limisphaerales bacterium]
MLHCFPPVSPILLADFLVQPRESATVVHRQTNETALDILGTWSSLSDPLSHLGEVVALVSSRGLSRSSKLNVIFLRIASQSHKIHRTHNQGGKRAFQGNAQYPVGGIHPP